MQISHVDYLVFEARHRFAAETAPCSVVVFVRLNRVSWACFGHTGMSAATRYGWRTSAPISGSGFPRRTDDKSRPVRLGWTGQVGDSSHGSTFVILVFPAIDPIERLGGIGGVGTPSRARRRQGGHTETRIPPIRNVSCREDCRRGQRGCRVRSYGGPQGSWVCTRRGALVAPDVLHDGPAHPIFDVVFPSLERVASPFRRFRVCQDVCAEA